jgi:hypothetical protein
LEQTKPTPGASTILSPKKANLKSKSLKPWEYETVKKVIFGFQQL